MIKSERFISRLKTIVPLVGLFLLIADMKPAKAQIIPDNTLGSESSQINSIEDLRTAIEGGATRGDNLFHSFQEFSIREGMSADFANPEGIANIFSRVTGSNISEIFGSLGVGGNANLFLMNPNGIVFGENAAINVGGSFMATTAQEIEFESGDKFSAANPNTPKITINFPIGLGFGNNSGAIKVNGRGHSLFLPVSEPGLTIKDSELPGFRVNRRENVALIGGEINFDGGVLIAEEGAIELGSIKSGIVKFDTDAWKFDYSDVSTFGDVNLSNTSWIDITNRSLLNRPLA